MGLFDDVYVDNKVLYDYDMGCFLCGKERQEFQTKSFENALDRYYLHYVGDEIKLHILVDSEPNIIGGGKKTSFKIDEAANDPEWPHQWCSIYYSCDDCNHWNEWKIKFTDGVAQKIEMLTGREIITKGYVI